MSRHKIKNPISLYSEKNECENCGRWNKVSVRFCKCGQKNEDHELYGRGSEDKPIRASQTPVSESNPAE